MTSAIVWLALAVALLLVLCWKVKLHRWRRPRLRTPDLPAELPDYWHADDPRKLAAALVQRERTEPRIIPGAEAIIRFHEPKHPARTRVCYLYLHGLSACRQETAPVTETLAQRDEANAVYARIAGHGMGDQAMSEVDGAAWLESVWEFWLMARALGDQVVVVATSTGAASAVWLLQQPGVSEKVRALLCMAPNFKVRNPLAFLLTWPGADYWLPQVVSPEKRWHSLDPRQQKYWSTNYGNRALIQMELLLEQVQHAPVETFNVPLMIQCSPEDPVVDAQFARHLFDRWGGEPKLFRWFTVAQGESPHVFVGDIMAPQNNSDVIQSFRDFLTRLPAAKAEQARASVEADLETGAARAQE